MKPFFSVLILCALCISAFSQKLQMHRQYLSIIIDASFSMNENLNGEVKMDLVKNAVTDFLLNLDNYGEIQVALHTFGSKEETTSSNKCTDYVTLVPFEIGNRAKVKAMLKRIEPKGGSPLGYAVAECVKSMPESDKRNVIVITDGGDACMQPLCEKYKELDSLTSGIFVLGVGVSSIDQELINCDPTFANITSAEDFKQRLDRILDAIKPY